MSVFNSYARKADEIAKAAFAEYREAEAAYKKAEAAARAYPEQHGLVPAEYAAKSARAKADFVEEKAAFDAARRWMDDHAAELQQVRRELASAIESKYTADPAEIDDKTLELLKSGILTVTEYAKLLDTAQNAGNHTMARLIGKYAEDAAAAMPQSDPKARELRAVANQSKADNGGDRLEAFGLFTDLFARCVRNPGMIDHWDRIAAETVEEF